MNDQAQVETPLWMALLHAASRVETRFESALAESGLSISKLGVLRTLVEAGEPMPLSRLAGKLSCVKSNVTQLVDRLEADGLVARVNDPADRRSVLASVTDEGRARFEAGRTAVAAVERDLFGAFEDDDRRRLAGVLASLARGGCGS